MSALVPSLIRRFETVVETMAGAHTPLRRPAEDASLYTLWATRAELSMQAIASACITLAETDENGSLINVDGSTGRILIPLPWGRNGGAKWGLRSSEQKTLTRILRTRAILPEALFDFDRQQWYLTPGFSLPAARAYLQRQPITVAEYRRAWDACAKVWRGKG
jgi:hypothetical protein